VPVAVKLVVSVLTTEAVVGLIAMTDITGAVTVKVALLELIPFADAVMIVLPSAKVDAMPLEFSVATEVLLDTHVTDPETLPELPSE
jgi:hypothetical protein